jgi:hypothetical protein
MVHETSSKNYQHTIYILSVVKNGLQNYCDTSYTRSGVNQMCILKNSKDLLERGICRVDK